MNDNRMSPLTVSGEPTKGPTMTKFLTLTVSPTEEALRAAWVSAGGASSPLHDRRPLCDELNALRRRMTFRQRVHIDRVEAWIEEMHAQGLVVVNVQPVTTPTA